MPWRSERLGAVQLSAINLANNFVPRFLIHPFSIRATGPNGPTLRVSQVPKRPNPHHWPQPGTALQGLYPEHKRHMSTKGTVKILTVLGEVLAHGKAKVQTSLCFPPLPPPTTPAVELCSAWGGPASTRKHGAHGSSAHASTPLCPPESYTRKLILMNTIQTRGAFLSLQITVSLGLLPFVHHLDTEA